MKKSKIFSNPFTEYWKGHSNIIYSLILWIYGALKFQYLTEGCNESITEMWTYYFDSNCNENMKCYKLNVLQGKLSPYIYILICVYLYVYNMHTHTCK